MQWSQGMQWFQGMQWLLRDAEVSGTNLMPGRGAASGAAVYMRAPPYTLEQLRFCGELA